MADGFNKITNGVRIVPGTTSGSVMGDIRVDSASALPKFYDGTREISMVPSGTVYNVKDYGAVGDGVTNDTSAINNAIAAATNGGKIYFPAGTYLCNSDITCAVQKTWLTGEGKASRLVFADGINLEISVSNVIVSDLWFDGQIYSTGTTTGNLITAQGASASTYIENIIVRNCHITNAPYEGVQLRFVKNFKVVNNYIENVYYAGIAMSSCEYGNVSNNIIRDIDKNSIGSGNAYGIFASRTDGSLSTYPRSKSILISENVIENNPTWEGLDTHCGQDIVFSNNTVIKCKIGIAVGTEGSAPGIVAPHRCVVIGNAIDSQLNSGGASYGIVMHGDYTTPEYASGCVISGNTVSRHGNATNNAGAAIYTYATSGLAISGNTIIEAGTNGINLSLETSGASIVGNVIVDSWTNSTTSARASGVFSEDNDVTAYIAGNTFTTASKSATYVMTEALTFPVGPTGYAIQLGDNYWAGTAANYMTTTTTGITSRRRLSLGSTSAPSLTFIGDDDTGLYRKAANSLGFISGGVEVGSYSSVGLWTLGSTGSTNVHVINGFVQQQTSSSTNCAHLLVSNTGDPYTRWASASGGFSLGVDQSDTNALKLNIGTGVSPSAGGENWKITQAGAWTIGSTSTTADHVINGTTQIIFSRSGGTYNDNSSFTGDIGALSPDTAQIRKFSNAGTKNLQGIAAPTAARILYYINSGGDTTIQNESTAATAADRIITGTGGTITLTGDGAATLIYDTGSSRWRIISTTA